MTAIQALRHLVREKAPETGFSMHLFRPGWTEQGIAVVVAKRFKGESNVAIWVSEFGERP